MLTGVGGLCEMSTASFRSSRSAASREGVSPLRLLRYVLAILLLRCTIWYSRVPTRYYTCEGKGHFSTWWCIK